MSNPLCLWAAAPESSVTPYYSLSHLKGHEHQVPAQVVGRYAVLLLSELSTQEETLLGGQGGGAVTMVGYWRRLCVCGGGWVGGWGGGHGVQATCVLPMCCL